MATQASEKPQDPCPWLPPHFEPLEVLSDGTRLTREQSGANAHGREGLYPRIKDVWPRTRSQIFRIVEVGSWAGGNALRMVWEFRDALSPVHVMCVDTWEGTPPARGDSTTIIAQAIRPENVFSTFLSNCRGKLFNRVVPLRGTSLFWAKQLPWQVDVVFIDADHSYEAVRQDLRAWWPVVKPNGLFCGHDYTLFDGVRQAVDEWVAEQGLELEVEEECWYVRKPA